MQRKEGGKDFTKGRTNKVTTVTHGSFSHTTSLEDGLDTDLELVNVVQSVENSEDVDAVLLCLLTEVEDGIVGE
jgi:hypothetical protein